MEGIFASRGAVRVDISYSSAAVPRSNGGHTAGYGIVIAVNGARLSMSSQAAGTWRARTAEHADYRALVDALELALELSKVGRSVHRYDGFGQRWPGSFPLDVVITSTSGQARLGGVRRRLRLVYGTRTTVRFVRVRPGDERVRFARELALERVRAARTLQGVVGGCSGCGVLFDEFDEICEHIKRVHMNRLLVEEQMIVVLMTGMLTSEYWCFVCPSRFTNRETFLRHVGMWHADVVRDTWRRLLRGRRRRRRIARGRARGAVLH